MSAEPRKAPEARQPESPADERVIQQCLQEGYAAPPPDRRFVEQLDQRLHEQYVTAHAASAAPAVHNGPSDWRTALMLGLGMAAAVLIAATIGLAGYGIWRLAIAEPQPQTEPPALAGPAAPEEHNTNSVDPVTAANATPRDSSTEINEPRLKPAVTDTQTITVADGPAKSGPRTSEGTPDKKVGVEKDMAGGPALRYGWQPGRRYTYQFKVEAKIDDTDVGAQGYVTYLPVERATARPAAEERKATGTGFLVDGQGHLITCAHVVKGATRLEVNLGTQKLSGKVISLDSRYDLALVKISGTSAAGAPLGNSAAVEVAQDVRVVGFPLTNQLGSSVKVTRGTVAGILDRQGKSLFQIDAPINAGNSGGPLINEQGQVIGVANAKLCGDEISNVGFAIPVAQVQDFLKRNNVTVANASGGATLPGPELVRRITPSVALLNVTTGPGGFGEEPALTLHYTADIHREKPATASSRSPFDPFGGPRMRSSGPYWQNERGKLVVDLAGELVEGSPEQSLPFLLGPTGLLALEPLGMEGESSWSRQRVLSLISKERQEQDDGLPFGPRMSPRRPFGSPFESPQPKEKIKAVVSAMERYDYEVSEYTDDKAVLLKRYELETLERDGPIKLQVKGNGRMVFDRQARVPSELTFDSTFELVRDNVTIRVPAKLTCTWQKDDGTGHDIPASKPTWTPPGAVAVTEETELKPKQLVFCAFHNQFPTVQVNEVLADGNVSVTFLGWDAAWKTTVPRSRLMMSAPKRSEPEKPQPAPAEQVDGSLAQLSDSNAFTVSRALGQLAKLEPNDRREEVLSKVTPLATESKDWMVREAAVSVLAKWGGEQSLLVLIEAAKDSHFPTRKRAIAALGEIPRRESAEALVQAFPANPQDARAALEKLGAIAEEPVATLLEHKQWHVQLQACELLGKIGTAKSLPPLRAAAERTTQLTKRAAENAIKAIEARETSRS